MDKAMCERRNLKLYNKDSRCDKCWSAGASARYGTVSTTERNFKAITRVCGVCGYEWHERPMDEASYSELDMLASDEAKDKSRAVILAHDRCIRFEIKPSGPGMLKLFFHKRKGRDGDISDKHPTLEQAIKEIRSSQC